MHGTTIGLTGSRAGSFDGDKATKPQQVHHGLEHTKAKGDALCETYAVHCKTSRAREKGEERFNSTHVDILHPAIQHGNVIHGFGVH